ncbi:MAG: polyprenyl synthetase family protein [Bradymonadia bacterium]
MKPELKDHWGRLKGLFESAVEAHMATAWAHWPEQLAEASTYALTSGGKRVRPVLSLMVAEACGAPTDQVMPWALAVEMIHNYSLVHDDLPCMDDDDLRRGRPTTHIKYGEGMAVLVGDVLLTEAFGVAGQLDTPQVGQLIRFLSQCAGGPGMVGGQVLDIGGHFPDLPALEKVHRLKTGALFEASTRGAAIAVGASPEIVEAMTEYGRAIGLLFQITDDILDAEQDAEEPGRSYLHHLSPDEVKAHRDATAARTVEIAQQAFGARSEVLQWVVEYIAHRDL